METGKKRSILPRATFIATKTRGVVYLEAGDGTRHYFIRYRSPGGRQHFERAVLPDGVTMTVAKAEDLRRARMRGKALPNAARRKAEREAKKVEAGRMTFDKLWQLWKEDPENAGKRGTVKADQRYRKHLKVPFGNREPKDLRPLDIDRLRLDLSKDHAKETTISVLSLIRRIERYGSARGLCSGLSFPIILKGKKLGRDPKAKAAPTDEQFESFVKVCEEWPDRQEANFMLFIAFTGIRRGSARNLKWEDLDLDGTPPTALLRDSKTGDVTVVLSDDAVELLRSHPETEDVEYVFTGKGWTPLLDKEGNPVMHKKNGRMRRMQTPKSFPQLTQRQIDRVPAKIMAAAGITGVDPCHAFRRRLATKVEAAHGIATAMKSGGWKTPAMVIRYTSTSNQTLRDAVNLLGRKNVKSKGDVKPNVATAM